MYRYVYIYIYRCRNLINFSYCIFFLIYFIYMFTTFAATSLIQIVAVGALPRTKQKKRN